MKMLTSRQRRTYRTRRRIQQPVDNGRLRLSVFRSSRYIYAQVIDDNTGNTMVEANSRSLGLTGNKIAQARKVGETLAARALEASVTRVVFDRGAYRYQGRVKALAEGAREGGLDF